MYWVLSTSCIVNQRFACNLIWCVSCVWCLCFCVVLFLSTNQTRTRTWVLCFSFGVQWEYTSICTGIYPCLWTVRIKSLGDLLVQIRCNVRVWYYSPPRKANIPSNVPSNVPSSVPSNVPSAPPVRTQSKITFFSHFYFFSWIKMHVDSLQYKNYIERKKRIIKLIILFPQRRQEYGEVHSIRRNMYRTRLMYRYTTCTAHIRTVPRTYVPRSSCTVYRATQILITNA